MWRIMRELYSTSGLSSRKPDIQERNREFLYQAALLKSNIQPFLRSSALRSVAVSKRSCNNSTIKSSTSVSSANEGTSPTNASCRAQCARPPHTLETAAIYSLNIFALHQKSSARSITLPAMSLRLRALEGLRTSAANGAGNAQIAVGAAGTFVRHCKTITQYEEFMRMFLSCLAPSLPTSVVDGIVQHESEEYFANTALKECEDHFLLLLTTWCCGVGTISWPVEDEACELADWLLRLCTKLYTPSPSSARTHINGNNQIKVPKLPPALPIALCFSNTAAATARGARHRRHHHTNSKNSPPAVRNKNLSDDTAVSLRLEVGGSTTTRDIVHCSELYPLTLPAIQTARREHSVSLLLLRRK
eukprot:PhM_4_TR11339/c0_g1_i2/m.103914